ncbi:hypothetical protein DIC82_09635 [Clostridium beijerinckii]|nr:hypothetical protein DIC82_09635 [Clostridium beijerinckii]
MNKTKKSISLIVEILLMFSIMLSVLSIFFKVVVLNENTYINILNENNIYNQVKESVYNKIDALLSDKNINYDIKELIITEDDIKREADNVISGFIQYLETGENNIKPIDVELYKQRVKDIMRNVIKPTKNDLSFNGNLQIENTVCKENELKYNNMIAYKEQSKIGQSSAKVEKIMTQSEAEAKVRDLLKQKGLTEEQAIKKATEKGITEEQALRILAGYGITIDENSDAEGNQSTSESSDNSGVSTKQGSDNTTKNFSGEASSNGQTENTINEKQADKSVKSQLDSVLNKLLDEAGSNIEKEIEKINVNNILESGKFKQLTQVTSIIYKMFWMFMILPIVLIAILIKINSKDMISGIRYVRNAFLLAGLILFAIFFGAYALKVYEKLNINIVYLKDVISYTMKHFLIILSTYGIVTFIIGLFMFMPTIKKSNK